MTAFGKPGWIGWPAAVLAAALPLGFLLSRSEALALPVALGVLLLLAAVILGSGTLLLRAARARDLPAAAAWVAGMLATSLVLLVLVLAFRVLAATALAIWAAIVLAWWLRARAPAPPRAGVAGLLGLLACGAATLYWCGELAQVPAIFSREGVLATWTDQFGHGAVIAQFGDPRAQGRGFISLADAPLLWYHYASYLPAAALAWPLDLPGLTLASSLWVPLGFFTLCAGAYTLGTVLAGTPGGFAALAALTLLPDPASYGLHNRLFGFYWYVIAVPTASYAVGGGLLAVALLQRWATSGDRRQLIASACVVGTLPPVRLHVFMLLLPAWVSTAVLTASMAPLRKLLLLAGGALLFALFVFGFYAWRPEIGPALWEFLLDLHTRQEPTAYRGVYLAVLATYGPDAALAAGLLVIVPACLGIFLLLYPLSVVAAYRSRGLARSDLIPVVLLVWYALLIVSAPTPAHGDATEFTQRPFVLVYAVIAVWTAAGFVPWLAARGGLAARRVWLPLLVAAALATMLVLRYTVGDWRWAYRYQAAEGLPEAARFVRSQGAPGEVLAAQGLRLDRFENIDLATQLVSLTGLPAYLATPYVMARRGDARHAAAVAERYAALQAVESEHTPERALARLARMGVRWYVVAESDRRGPHWDPGRQHAVFVDRMVAVYSARP